MRPDLFRQEEGLIFVHDGRTDGQKFHRNDGVALLRSTSLNKLKLLTKLGYAIVGAASSSELSTFNESV